MWSAAVRTASTRCSCLGWNVRQLVGGPQVGLGSRRRKAAAPRWRCTGLPRAAHYMGVLQPIRTTMARGLDHIVHAVRDLDACAALYERLGFVVGARNRHDWGTHNRMVQLSGFFIELLTVAEPDKLGSDGLSQQFGAPHRDFLGRHEGLSGLLLDSRDAAADAALFRAGGIAASDAMRFGREGRR